MTGIARTVARVHTLLALGAVACGGNTTPTPTAPGGPVTFASCGLLQSNTSYVLSRDLSSTTGTCLSVQGSASVQLDCQNHEVSSIDIVNGSRITIANCAVTGAVIVSSSNTVTITASTLSGGVMIGGTPAATIDHSTVTAPPGTTVAVSIAFGTGDQLTHDMISFPNNTGSEAVYLRQGSGNQVLENTISSSYAGGLSKAGADDGVVLDNETGDTIRGNTIIGFWDTAVEGLDAITNLIVADNTISTIGTAGVGSYWCTSWTNNVIQNNDVGQAPSLARVLYQTSASLCTSPFVAPAFAGNQFIDNKLHDVVPGLGFVNTPKMSVTFTSGDVENNLLRGDDFGANDGPFLSPLSGFVDGGGNVCGPMNPSLSNFVCTGGMRPVRGRGPR